MEQPPEIELFFRLVRKLGVLVAFVVVERLAVSVIQRVHSGSTEIDLLIHGLDVLTVAGSLIYFAIDWVELLWDRVRGFGSRRGGDDDDHT